MPPIEAPADIETGLMPWHREVWQRIQAQWTNGRLPHAMLLQGKAGLGKEVLADCLAQALVCEHPQDDGTACGHCHACVLAQAGHHPDIQWLRPDEPGKQIKVDAVREACARSVLTAGEGSHRILLIAPAEQMNAAAANALLKTLEEPVERTVILLISDTPHRLPATVRSRCQKQQFLPPSTSEALDWLASDIDRDPFVEALALSGGAPLAAVERLRQEVSSRMRSAQDALFGLAEGRLAPAQVAADWQQMSIDEVIELLQFWLSDLVRLKTSDDPPICYFEAARARLHSLAERIDFRGLFAFSDRIQSASLGLSNNLNPQLLTERLLIDWCNTARSTK